MVISLNLPRVDEDTLTTFPDLRIPQGIFLDSEISKGEEINRLNLEYPLTPLDALPGDTSPVVP